MRALRDITALKAAVGSDGFAEGVAPRDKDYPYVVYRIAASTRVRDWSGMQMHVWVDAFVVSKDQVEAHTLDQLMDDGLDDAQLDLETGTTGQTTLYCRRRADLSLAALDDTGDKVYQIGGTYEVWTDQLTA